MRGSLLVLVLALTGALVAAAQEGQYTDGIVAVVEGEPITRHELELQCRLEPRWHRLPRGDSPARTQLLKEMLDQLVELKVLLAVAKEQKVALTPQDEERVQATIGRIAEQNHGINGLREIIEKEIGVPWDHYVDSQRQLALRHKLLIQSVSRDIFPTPEEIRRFYEAHASEFVRSGELRLRRIVIFKSPDDGPHLSDPLKARLKQGPFDAAAFLAELRAKIVSGEVAFEDAQRQWSQDPSFGKEEDFSTDRPLSTQLRPAVLVERIEALQPGETSDIIDAGPQGLILVDLLDRQAEGRVPLADVQEQIEMVLKEAEWKRRQTDWVATKRADAHVELFIPAPGNK